MLPGNPIAYLTGSDESSITTVKEEFYRNALHLDDNIFMQFFYYLKSLFDGTLGYSYKKERTVLSLILENISPTLQITVSALLISTITGLCLGLAKGYKNSTVSDKAVTTTMIVLNTVPVFLIALVLITLFCFTFRWFPIKGLNNAEINGFFPWLLDRCHHLVLPVLTLVISITPSRYLLMRNTSINIANEKYVLYAKERGLSSSKVQYSYMLKNIAAPFITMVGMSVGMCVGGSVVIENIFSINGMGKLLTNAVYSLDYPLIQGILFVTTATLTISVIITDLICILIDPKVRLNQH